MKFCHTCSTSKPTTEFHKHTRSKDGLQSACKSCLIAKRRKYVAENPTKIKAYSKKWYAANSKKDRERRRQYYWANKKAGPRFTGDPLEDPRTTKNPN